MSHEIDESTGKPAIAYVGETPWHGLGQQLTAGADLKVWRTEAGLDWQAVKSPIKYQIDAEVLSYNGRNVLYRNDTQAPLSVVSDDYKIVQPEEVLDFFGKLAEIGGFQLETAGSLSGGRRIWALAKVNEGADIVSGDRVQPYVMLATSYDGSTATTAKFTAVRVVCKNTIEMALAADKEKEIRVVHSAVFAPDTVRLQLGIVANAWEKFQVRAGLLGKKVMVADEGDTFLVELLKPYMAEDKREDVESIKKTKGYRQIKALFEGAALGSTIAGSTRWGMLNAVTEYVDHKVGKTRNSRIESAWFGQGNAMKTRALELLSA